MTLACTHAAGAGRGDMCADTHVPHLIRKDQS